MKEKIMIPSSIVTIDTEYVHVLKEKIMVRTSIVTIENSSTYATVIIVKIR